MVIKTDLFNNRNEVVEVHFTPKFCKNSIGWPTTENSLYIKK